MNLEDIKKLTVADLKKELKARNLHVTGNKSELTQRLTEHILNSEERQLLDTSGNIDESLLEGVHEDEVLGLSSNDSPLTGSISSPENNTTLKRGPTLSTTAKIPASTTVTTNATAAPKPATDNVQNGSKAEQQPQEEAKKIRLMSTASSDSAAAPKVAPKISGSVGDPEEKKIERAKKFNLPLPEEDRKKLRAERFGLDSGNGGSKKANQAALITNNVALDPEVLMKRAQRFGVPVVKTSRNSITEGVEPTKLKERAERFGLQKQEHASTGKGGSGDEMLSKRKLRFEGGSSSVGDNGDMNEKKKARAERFGLAQ